MTIDDLKGGYTVVGAQRSAAPTQPTTPAPSGVVAPFAPATPNDAPLVAGAKTAANLIPSTINFGKSTFDFLNPLTHVQEGLDLAKGLSDNAPPVADIAKEIPGQAYKMLVPQFLQHIFKGDIGQAASAIENDPVGQIAPLVLLARQGAEAAGKGAEFDNMISTAAKPVTAPTSAVAGAIGDATGNVARGSARFAASQLTGLSPDTITRIVQNPQEFSKAAESEITRPALADGIKAAITERQKALEDTSGAYGGIRTGTTPVSVLPDYLSSLIQETTGLTVGPDGKLQTSGAASVRNPADVSALQRKIVDVWKPEFEKGYLTPSEFLNLRQDLAAVANYDGVGKSTPLEAAGEQMRAKLNGDLRGDVPGLTELDAKFAPEITQLKALTRNLVDKNGELTDAAINRIANATGKGKDPQLARLEALSPGITDRIRLLKAVEDLSNSRENKPGTYIRAAALGSGVITLNPYLIVSAIASLPEVAVPLLRGLGYSAQTAARLMKTLGIDSKAAATASAVKAGALKGAIGAGVSQNAKR